MSEDLRKLNDEQLQKRADELAQERTRVRIAQNDVASEQEIRRAVASLPPHIRDAARERME